MFRLIRVEGDSMSPTLVNGDYILIKKARSRIKPQPGLIYVIDHLRLGQIIKRLSRVNEKGLWFSGDSPESTSTETLGPTRPNDITGRAVLKISPKSVRLL
ncbi:S24 family peptidase [Litorimonas sp.]|uniref:S24 family peptidase n=1 Tax=Litorimonas sp. TaxID=1892381 RepID=UPI003A888FC6